VHQNNTQIERANQASKGPDRALVAKSRKWFFIFASARANYTGAVLFTNVVFRKVKKHI
jgi:hypothetical protein